MSGPGIAFPQHHSGSASLNDGLEHGKLWTQQLHPLASPRTQQKRTHPSWAKPSHTSGSDIALCGERQTVGIVRPSEAETGALPVCYRDLAVACFTSWFENGLEERAEERKRGEGSRR
eukprot:2324824-Rhodomonas_salina.1